ncbi:trypsin-like serine protease [Hyalangium sp.]|uniref:trypsin-like serine protease n=1 Tax=Hyalangium sp. TaxID=2028555 RepID=UPI002D533F24|nr:trypsin-like serine protease [Hyalangium sp.]HYI02096.1 trypsin-like serine protease [Hyalangium sp.]
MTGLIFTLLIILHTGCSTATPAIVASQDAFEPEDLFPQGMLLTVPGRADEENKYLPAVRVSSVIIDSARVKHYKPCSGVLVHPRLVITAGHCVCLERSPTEQEQVQPKAPVPKKAAKSPAALTQAAALKGVERITGIIDNKSPCATTTTVTTTVYSPQNGRRGTRTEEYSGTVMVHEQLRMVMGVRRENPLSGQAASPGRRAGPTLVWNNADLAAIFLKDAVSSAFEPAQLAMTEEIKLGSRVIIIGYGPGSSPHLFGDRQYGENAVTRIIPLETGSVLFRTELQVLPAGGPASYAEQGDSGGACVAKTNPHVLVGFVTAGAQKETGSYMSYFTSVYSHKDWLERAINRANES